MQRLWAPWRKTYIRKKKPAKGCIFCAALRSPRRKDPETLLLFRSQHSFVILNRYPYINGHLMVVPNRHLADLEKLSDRERLDLMGKVGGAGIAGHFHLHVVPRWLGDTNFMPLLTETKVISDFLQSTYRELVRAL